jgi:hypothetical protein
MVPLLLKAGGELLLCALLMLCSFNSIAQTADPVSISTTTDRVITRDTLELTDSLSRFTYQHSVKRATMLSALLPGAGQVYNKKIWKVPIIYAAFGGLVYLVKFNNDRYNIYENALLLRYDDNPDTYDEFQDIYSDDNLRSLRDFYRRNRDLSVVGISLVYVLNIIDAHVDAHLFSFNVDDNLSLNWSPVIHPSPQSATAGVRLQFQF